LLPVFLSGAKLLKTTNRKHGRVLPGTSKNLN
jgi:hypothetical protein